MALSNRRSLATRKYPSFPSMTEIDNLNAVIDLVYLRWTAVAGFPASPRSTESGRLRRHCLQQWEGRWLLCEAHPGNRRAAAGDRAQ
jgi:hypothetical protein